MKMYYKKHKSVNDKKYNSESEHSNSFKTDSLENNNQDPLENNLEDKDFNTVSKEIHEIKIDGDVVENSFKTDSLENKLEDKYSNTVSEEIHEIKVDKGTRENCKATVISETLPICENSPYTSEVTPGPVTVKVPVVITECSITITVQSSLKLEEGLLEIKHIRKNVYLNQCKLIPNSEDGRLNTGILFLEGFIRKNIEYTSKDNNAKGVLSSKLKHTTIKVPFKCTTRVTFKTPPKFKANMPQDEVEILETNIKVCDPCEEHITGRNICEKNFKLTEFFNEKVFCELISAEIIESDILENPINKECKSPIERPFSYITEKVVLLLTIKLLQNQNVVILK